MPTVDAERIEAIRSFNRFYTNRIGVLREGLHRSPHPLAEARVLFELGRSDVTEVADLRRALDLDAGQLSRLLSRLEQQGLVVRERSPLDARRQRLRLTPSGTKAYRMLDRGAVRQWRDLLGGLDEDDQRRLLEAMGVVRSVLDGQAAEGAPSVALRGPGAGELGWIVARHGALYFEEYGWDVRFEALVAQVVTGFAGGHDPGRERCWIADVGGRAAGCVLCVRRDEHVAQLRLLLVEPWARGLGVGRALVEACVRFARDAGYRELTLWTNAPLVAARRIYDRAGFTVESEEPHTLFGPELLGQQLTLAL